MKTNLCLCLMALCIFAASSEGLEREKRATDNILKSETRKIIIDKDALPGLIDEKGENRCVTKSVTVHETKYNREQECKHILKEKCHLTYITDYHSVAEEKCETNYIKDCHIVFKATPHTEKVKKCHTPYIRQCNATIKGPDVCSNIHEDFCETRYEKYTIMQNVPKCELNETRQCENKTIPLLNLPGSDKRPAFAVKEICSVWPIQICRIEEEQLEKVHPKTKCNKETKKICMPSNCMSVKGEKICVEEEQTVVQNIPEEECELSPQKNCKTESALVPRLVPKKSCVKVPKEICINVKSKPKIIPTKVTKLWCYNPDDLVQ